VDPAPPSPARSAAPGGYRLSSAVWPHRACPGPPRKTKQSDPFSRFFRLCGRCRGTGLRLRSGYRMWLDLIRLHPAAAPPAGPLPVQLAGRWLSQLSRFRREASRSSRRTGHGGRAGWRHRCACRRSRRPLNCGDARGPGAKPGRGGWPARCPIASHCVGLSRWAEKPPGGDTSHKKPDCPRSWNSPRRCPCRYRRN
jgi:hypothetical protein